MDFSSDDIYLSESDSNSVVNLEQGTIETWVKVDTISSNNRVIFSYGGDYNDQGFLLQSENSIGNKIGFKTWRDNSQVNTYLGNTFSTDNLVDQWVHLVATYDNEYQKKNLFTKLIVRKSKKRNLASSINEGIALSKFENIIWLDADFQHPPKYLEDFIKYSNKNDIIIASRFLKNSNRYFQDDKFKKKTNENQSYIYNKICNYLFFDDVTDYTSGFICVKKKCRWLLPLQNRWGFLIIGSTRSLLW